MKRLFNLVLTMALAACVSAPAMADPQPVQWRYSFDSNGVATATYPGNTSVAGTQTIATIDATTIGITGSTGGNWQLGNQAYAAGSLMKIDNLWFDGGINPKTEGAIWSTSTYAANTFAHTMTAATVTGQGSGALNNGPLTTLYSVAYGNGGTGDVVAGLFDCIAKSSNSPCFGGNAIARNDTGLNSKLVGFEVDVEFATGSTDAGGSIGIPINVFGIASSANAIQIGNVGAGTWGNGLIGSGITGTYLGVNSSNATTAVSFIDSTNGTFSSSAIKLGKGASQAINLGGGSFGVTPFLYGDSGNNLNLVSGSGNFFVLKNTGGTTLVTFDLAGGSITTTGGIKYPYFTVATLPTCNSGSSGLVVAVSDATAPTYRGALVGGGAVKTPVFCDGTSWTSH